MPENPARAKQGARTWTDFVTPKLIIGVVIAIVALLFVFQNTSTGHFHFLFLDVKAPRWLWLLGVFAAGLVTGFLIARHRSQVSAARSASSKTDNAG